MTRILSILIVDDSKALRMVIKNLLSNLDDYDFTNIKEAGNGEEALTILKEGHPDIIFTDINMPIMNGIEFIENLKSLGNTTPIFVISTDGSQDTVIKAIKLGAKGYIKKPFSSEKVSGLLNKLFKQ